MSYIFFQNYNNRKNKDEKKTFNYTATLCLFYV